MKKTFNYGQLQGIVQTLRGTPGANNGLAFRPFPVATVIRPIRAFLKAAEPHLEVLTESGQELQKRQREAEEAGNHANLRVIQEDYIALLDTEIEIEFDKLDITIFDDREDLTLADYEVLELLCS